VRSVSVLIICVLILGAGRGMGTIPEEATDIVTNGTFDADLNGWSIGTSQNMTINVTNGCCNFSTTKTAYTLDYNYTTMHLGTFYNVTLYNGTESDKVTSFQWDYFKLNNGCSNGSYTSKVFYYGESYEEGNFYTPHVNYTPYYADWLIVVTLSHRSVSPPTGMVVYTRSGITAEIDNTWSDWQIASYVNSFPFGFVTGEIRSISSPNSLYIQYKIELSSTSISVYAINVGNVPASESYDWAEISQKVPKPEASTNFITYDYKAEVLNNTKEVYLFTKLNGDVIDIQYITNVTNWTTVVMNVSSEARRAGTYNLTLYLFDGFNSANGTAIILMDNVTFYYVQTSTEATMYILSWSLLIIIVVIVIRKVLLKVNKDVTNEGGK